MSRPLRQFHLLVEPVDSTVPTSAAVPGLPAGLTPLPVPAGVWCLQAPAGEPPRLTQEPPETGTYWVIEAVVDAPQPRLVLCSPAERPSVNGRSVPPVALLDVKDQVQLAADWLLHVTLHFAPAVGPPPAEFVGKECPLCRVPFAPDTIVYLCHGCGTPLHCEGEGKLECVPLASECPVCNTPVVLQAGYAYVPEPVNA